MATQPSDPDIPHLLAELQSGDFVNRLAAVKALAAAKPDTAEVVNALKAAAEADSSRYVREAALSALTALGVAVGDLKAYVAPRVVDKPQTRTVKIMAFAIGFVGWNLVSFLLAGPISSPFGQGARSLSIVLGLANPIVLIVLAFKRRWVAFGMLSALVLNAIGALVAGWLVYNCDFACTTSIGVYFVPFWLLYPFMNAWALF